MTGKKKLYQKLCNANFSKTNQRHKYANNLFLKRGRYMFSNATNTYKHGTIHFNKKYVLSELNVSSIRSNTHSTLTRIYIQLLKMVDTLRIINFNFLFKQFLPCLHVLLLLEKKSSHFQKAFSDIFNHLNGYRKCNISRLLYFYM